MNLDDNLEPTPPKKYGVNSYRPEEIKRWGVQRFLDERAKLGPVPIPDFQFTEEENRRMDEIIEQERQATANGLCLRIPKNES